MRRFFTLLITILAIQAVPSVTSAQQRPPVPQSPPEIPFERRVTRTLAGGLHAASRRCVRGSPARWVKPASRSIRGTRST